ncbi:MAG: hydrolase [Acidiferrobacter sp.]
MLKIHRLRAALVVIDLQKGIVDRTTAPYPSLMVVANAARLTAACRARGLFIVLVNVAFAADQGDRVNRPCDQPMPPVRDRGLDWAAIVPELDPQITDYHITKHQWGAFYGTDLDLQLRRRGIDTLILCGIATNIGVETTARNASERNYAQIFAEDAMAAMSAAEHAMSVTTILPRLGHVRSTNEIISALA